MMLLEAQLITCEGHAGWKTARHLGPRTRQGNVLQTSDACEAHVFTDLEQAIAYCLGVTTEWLGGAIEAEYQRRGRRWHGGWAGATSW